MLLLLQSLCHDVDDPNMVMSRFGVCQMVDVVQRYHSSLFKLEGQNCLSWPGYVLTLEDDLVQFWRGNMLNLIDMNLKLKLFGGWIGYGLVVNEFYHVMSFRIKLT